MNNLTMEKLVALCKNRGFVFPGSEIYGGFANTWDFGPVGVELKNNIKRAWWKRFVQEDPNTYGVDAAILMNPRVWEASGHVASFGDPKWTAKNVRSVSELILWLKNTAKAQFWLKQCQTRTLKNIFKTIISLAHTVVALIGHQFENLTQCLSHQEVLWKKMLTRFTSAQKLAKENM